MAVSTMRPNASDMSSTDEIHGVLQTFAASMIALTAVDAIMIAVNRLPLPDTVRLDAVRFGEWLFVPACMWVGWVSRQLGQRRYLPLAGAFALTYTLLTQFRGSWIWDGTFDNFMYPRTLWVMTGLTGIVCAFLIGNVPPRQKPKAASSHLFLVGLAIALVGSAFLPRLWPNDSDFAPTRHLGLAGALVALIALALYARNEE